MESDNQQATVQVEAAVRVLDDAAVKVTGLAAESATSSRGSLRLAGLELTLVADALAGLASADLAIEEAEVSTESPLRLIATALDLLTQAVEAGYEEVRLKVIGTNLALVAQDLDRFPISDCSWARP